MKMNEGNLIIKALVSPSDGNNVYVLINGDEAAVIDTANAYDDIRNILDEMGIGLKYLLVTHGHKSNIQSVSMLKKNLGGTFCLY